MQVKYIHILFLYFHVGKLPEFVAKWLARSGIPPSMLCLSQESTGLSRQQSSGDARDEEKVSKELEETNKNPIVGQYFIVELRSVNHTAFKLDC